MINELNNKKIELQNELKSLLKEIEPFRQKNDRARDIELEIYQIDKKIKYESRIKYIGKCFKAVDNNGYEGIKAFKILQILPEPNVDYALCSCIGEKDVNTAFVNYAKSIKIIVVPLWIPSKLRLMSNDNDKKIIEEYQEITQEEFTDLLKSMIIDFTKRCNEV